MVHGSGIMLLETPTQKFIKGRQFGLAAAKFRIPGLISELGSNRDQLRPRFL